MERLTVTAYPIVERDGIAWIWMGEKDKGNSDLIPNFDAHSDTNFQSVYGLIAVNGNYQLVSDNLLDLSHTQYLHAALAIEIDEQAFLEVDLIEKENTLTTTNNIRNGKKNPFAEFVWPDGPERIENYGGLYWSPPANMNLKVHMGIIGEPEEQAALQAWGAELVTPETETSCHYFWSFARNYRQQDTVLNTTLQQMISSVFEGEDATIIAKVQKNMGTETDLLTLKPVILSTDSAAVRARRILDKLIKTESSESC